MKLVPKRRFKGFSGEWEERKLSEIAEINPQAMLPESFNYVDLESVVGTELIAYRTENKKSAPSRAQRLAVRGDVFYQTVRPYQKNNYLFDSSSNNFVFSTGYAQMRPNVDSHFLFSRIQEDSFVNSVLSKCTGTSYPAISSSDLADIEINVPADRSEQVKIGLFFKDLDNNIILQERHLKKLQAMKQAYLHEMFPAKGESAPKRRFEGFTAAWKRYKLCSLVDRFDNLRIPVKESDRIPGVTPYYGANGVLDYVDGFTHDGEYVLIAEDGANDLNDYPVYYTNGEIWVNNHAHVIQAKEDIADNKFLVFALKTVDMSSYLVGGSRPKLNAEVMMNIMVYSPCINEQIKIGEFFYQLDKRIAKQKEKANKLKAMKQAYLHEMFV